MVAGNVGPVGDIGAELNLVGVDGDVQDVVFSGLEAGICLVVILICIVNKVEVGEIGLPGVGGGVCAKSVGKGNLLATCTTGCSEGLGNDDEVVEQGG